MSAQSNALHAIAAPEIPDCPFNSPRQADVVSDISYRDFISKYVNTRTPVVIRGALNHLPAASWTPETFRKKWGEKQFELEGKQWALSEIIDLTIQSSPSEPAPYLVPVHKRAVFRTTQILPPHFVPISLNIMPFLQRLMPK